MVIGAGIAGAQVAWHLAIRGWQVAVVERHTSAATEASGNPAAIISPQVSAKPSIAEQFSVQAFLYQLAQFKELGAMACGWNPCGALQLAVSSDKQRQWQSLQRRNLPCQLVRCLDQNTASTAAGIQIDQPALLFQEAGYVQPDRFINTLIAHENITLTLSCDVQSLESADGQWLAADAGGAPLAAAPVAVIASGSGLNFTQTFDLPHSVVKGQTSFAACTPRSNRLKVIVQHDGYITPAFDGRHLLGASYERHRTDLNLDSAVDQANLNGIARHTPNFFADLGPVSSAHAAVRMASSNRMPYVGPVTNAREFNQRFPEIRRDQFGDKHVSCLYPGLFISGAHGSRGFTNAALAGELIASMVCGESSPIQKNLSAAVHPARVLVKRLIA